MRSLLLASAAVIISAGVACAQTAGPASPSGPTTATPLTDSGSSGTTATPPPSGGSPSMAPPMASSTGATTAKPLTDSGSSGSANTPSTTGTAMSAPASSPSAAPDMAPATPVATTTTPMPMHHHHMMMGMAMPASGSATDYLHYAKGAVKHHNKMAADNALAMAETRMLNGVVPQGQIAPDNSPAIASIEKARKDVDMGDMSGASAAIDMAMQGGGGMTSSDAAPPPPAAGMAPPMHPASYTKSQGQMGGAPAVNETSDSAAAGGPTHMGAAPISSPPTP